MAVLTRLPWSSGTRVNESIISRAENITQAADQTMADVRLTCSLKTISI